MITLNSAEITGLFDKKEMILVGRRRRDTRTEFETSRPEEKSFVAVEYLDTFFQFWRSKWEESYERFPSNGWTNYATTDEKHILKELVFENRKQVAVRLNELIEMFVEDPDVGSLDISSMRSLADFFLINDLPMPDIVADYDGTLGVEWRLSQQMPVGEEQYRGMLCMDFLSNGEITYMGRIRSADGKELMKWEDSSTREETMTDIESFFSLGSEFDAIRG